MSRWSVLLLLLFTADTLFLPIVVSAGPVDIDIPISSSQYSETVVPILGGTVMELVTSDDAFDGYNLFDLVRLNYTNRRDALARSIVLLTMDGTPVLEMPELLSPVEMMNSTTILCNSVAGATLWNIETGKLEHLGFIGHH